MRPQIHAAVNQKNLLCSTGGSANPPSGSCADGPALASSLPALSAPPAAVFPPTPDRDYGDRITDRSAVPVYSIPNSCIPDPALGSGLSSVSRAATIHCVKQNIVLWVRLRRIRPGGPTAWEGRVGETRSLAPVTQPRRRVEGALDFFIFLPASH
jgi:hypothetical protein